MTADIISLVGCFVPRNLLVHMKKNTNKSNVEKERNKEIVVVCLVKSYLSVVFSGFGEKTLKSEYFIKVS